MPKALIRGLALQFDPKFFLSVEGKISCRECHHCASEMHRIEKLHKTKSKCLMVTFNSCFIQDPQIPNFYLANLKTDVFLKIFTGPWAPGLHQIKKMHNTQC